MCLLSQNTEPRGEPLMAERDMSTFRIGVQRQCNGTHSLPDDQALDLRGSDPFRFLLTDGLGQNHDSHQLSSLDCFQMF